MNSSTHPCIHDDRSLEYRIWGKCIFFTFQAARNNTRSAKHKYKTMYIASYARQKDANAHVILTGAHRSARHMRRTFDTCFTLSLIYNFYVLFVWISYQARFGLKISYPAIVFTMVIGLLNCVWEFSAGNKQSLHIVSFSALRMRSRHSAGHTTIGKQT